MTPVERTNIRAKIVNVIHTLQPRPNTGIFWQDTGFLMLIIFLQTSILPHIIPLKFQVDLVTAWLLITFIHQAFTPALLLCIIGAISLEMRSAVPAGLYISAYTILLTIIHQIKPKLYWRHHMPWIVIFAIASLWISSFESLVVYVMNGLTSMTWEYWFGFISRILSVTIFGLYLSAPHQPQNAEEKGSL